MKKCPFMNTLFVEPFFLFWSSSILGDFVKSASSGGAPKERRRHRAEKRLSQSVILESPFLLCPLEGFRCFRAGLKGAEILRRNGLFKDTFLDNRFSAGRLFRSFSTPRSGKSLEKVPRRPFRDLSPDSQGGPETGGPLRTFSNFFEVSERPLYCSRRVDILRTPLPPPLSYPTIRLEWR